MSRITLLTMLCFQILSLGPLAAQEQVLEVKPLSPDVEVVNPLRGLYTWLGFDAAPQPERALDRYARFPWAALEPAQSRYDFSQIESEIAKLPPGGSFAFRIVAMNPNWSWKDGSDIPPYLVAAMPKGFFVPAVQRKAGAPAHLYIPDWNSPIFLDRLDKLLAALGEKYDGDPRISFIDIGVYGTWGEWHTFGLPNFPGSAIPYWNPALNSHGALPGTIESRKRVVDAHVKAFKKTRLVMMTDDKEALVYALRLPAPVPVGIRRDSFGSKHFAAQLLDTSMPRADQDLVMNRWRTAPFVVESFGPPKAFEVGDRGLVAQVEDYHISAIANGGFGDWNQLPSQEQQALLEGGRRSGYRLAVTEAALPRDVARGSEVLLRTKWENRGVAPPYEPWNVEFSLWKMNGDRPVIRVVSALCLQKLLPTTQPLEVRDSLAIPKKISKGSYELRVKITDSASYRNPLRLAIMGANSDGSYSLGAVLVN